MSETEVKHFLGQGRPPIGSAGATVLAWAILAAAACSSPNEPEPVPDEPDPFPGARSVRLWIRATGLVLYPPDTVREGFFVDEPGASNVVYRCPADVAYSCPSDFRSAWWSSDSRVVTVDSTGLISAVGPGEAVVWVQVESERDSALVRVLSNTGDVGARFVQIEAGGSHTCALDEDGRTYCWGSDVWGALGRGRVRWFTRAGAPAPVAGTPVFAQLTAGESHTCGLAREGDAWCWGENGDGQVGNGLFDRNRPLAYEAGVPEATPVVGGIQFDTLVSANETTCGLAGGSAYCWGWNFNGELGIGSPDPQDDRAEPKAVTGGLAFRLLAGGDDHICGVTTGHETYCWGEHKLGVFSNEPVLVADAPSFIGLAAGFAFTCGLTAPRQTYCWGYNNRGQLGHNDPSGSEAPTLLVGGFEFVQLAAHTRHTCGLTAAGEAYCWGSNDVGQLGRGERNFDPNPTPRPVVGSLAFESLTAGQGHTCAITADDRAYCWGELSNGQLGNGQVRLASPPFGAGVPYWPSPQRVVGPME